VPVVLYADINAPLRLVSAPTAGLLPGKAYSLETYLFDGDGVAQRISAGITDILTVGVSYGGSHIIGASRVEWQPHVCVQARIRIIEETLAHPALAIGFDSQGEGSFLSGKKLNRFVNKSKGSYLVVSRNYNLLGNLGLHGGANYSLENDDGDYDPSFWAGIDKDFGSNMELCCEYDFATNDNENRAMTSNRGYLNCAVRLNFGGSFTLEFDLRNILRNAKKNFIGRMEERPEPSREIRFCYTARW
jgi:hypothetical protein